MTAWAQVSNFIFTIKVGHYPTKPLACLHLISFDIKGG